MHESDLQRFLDNKVRQYQNPAFIAEDPIAVPHQYSGLQDIEIAGFFAALFAWGRRSLILKKAMNLLQLMDNAPYDFVLRHEEKDLKRFLGFAHRTFNAVDIIHFITFLKKHYQKHPSLEHAFSENMTADEPSIEKALNGFHHLVFEKEFPKRSTKHISAPCKKSACKRLNMFLRWMVRSDKEGVDFGLWRSIRADQLVIPMDTHVCRVAGRLGLIVPDQPTSWKTAVALTDALKEYDAEDPVKYDFALFGLGIIEKFT